MIEERTVAAVAGGFAGGGELQSAGRHGSGDIHDTYSVKFGNDGRAGAHIILQHINTNIFKDPVAMMENIHRVTTHLRSRLAGVPDADERVLQLVPTRDGGAWHVDDEERYWRAYWFIE